MKRFFITTVLITITRTQELLIEIQEIQAINN